MNEFCCHQRLALRHLLSLSIVVSALTIGHSLAAQDNDASQPPPIVLKDYVPCQFSPADEKRWDDSQSNVVAVQNAVINDVNAAVSAGTATQKQAAKLQTDIRKAQSAVQVSSAISESKLPPDVKTQLQSTAQSADVKSATSKRPQFIPPPDVLCSQSILGFKEASDIFGKRIATTYLVIQVVVRNLNQKNDFLLHDVQVRVQNSHFRAGRDKLLARGVSMMGQTMDSRNLIMGGLDTLSATAGAISLIGAAATPVSAAFQGLSNGNNVLTAFLPPLKRWFPDYTVDQLNRLNDMGFSASSTYKIIVPKGGSIPFVTFVPQQVFPTQVRKWTPSEFLNYDNTTLVLVAGALIQELTGAPSIASLTPSSGSPGTSVTISGTNFGTTQGTVNIGSSQATVTSWAATAIIATVSSDLGIGPTNVVVHANNLDSTPATFTVTPSAPSLSPNSGPANTLVTISGTNFGTKQGTVKFGSTTGQVESWTKTQITVRVPNIPAGQTNIVVSVNGADSSPATFNVTIPPAIGSLTPPSGPPDTSVTISGTNFGSTPGTIKFGSTTAAVGTWSDTSITMTVPHVAAASASVVVSANGLDSNAVTFSVTTPPIITLLSSASGPPNTGVTVSGANFGTTPGTVKFGSTTAPVQSWSATSLVVTVPNLSAGPTSVVVTVNGLDSAAAAFTVTPSITSVLPTSGTPGSSVTIAGGNFGTSQGTVKFGTIAATVSTWSANSITVVVPSIAAGQTSVVVSVGATDSAPTTFTVSPH